MLTNHSNQDKLYDVINNIKLVLYCKQNQSKTLNIQYHALYWQKINN